MTSTLDFESISEVDAAVMLIVATVVADNKVDPRETKELAQQVRLLAGWGEIKFSDLENNVANLAQYADALAQSDKMQLSSEQILKLADKISDQDLRIAAMNAIFEVAFVDDEFHEDEKAIVTVLKEYWGL